MDQVAPLDFDGEVIKTLHQGTPVAVSTGRARSANVSAILANMVLKDHVSPHYFDLSERMDSNMDSCTCLTGGEHGAQ